ncbi:DUF3054 domain-containing protein [Tersicoccus sp. MR15.9]|uniref:DUF3054 domain-containing protein n=1 Tax=Tersicoccus mangrovi TaxID=3121635 RepID=UPI002FE64C47
MSSTSSGSAPSTSSTGPSDGPMPATTPGPRTADRPASTPGSDRSGGRKPATRRPGTSATGAAVADAVLVLVFAAIGRASHQEGDAVLGVLTTAWPFLAGAAIGWLLIRAWRAPTRVWPTGVVVWVAAVAGGMVLRAVTGAGIAPSFIVVATITLAVFLLGWRAVVALIRRRSRRGAGSLPKENLL